MRRIGNRVSYIKKPFAEGGILAAGLCVPALLFLVAAVGIGCYTKGNAPLYAAGMGLCSILLILASVSCGIFSFFEKDKNYFLSKAGLAADGVMALVWILVISTAL